MMLNGNSQKINRYQAFLLGFLLVFSGSNLLWIALGYFQLGAPTTLSKFQTLQLERKLASGKKKDSPRLIFVSASSSMFGLRTTILEKGLNRNVINLGLSGNFGIEGLLYYAKKVARPKDTVVLGFEYALFDWATYESPNIETLDFLFSIAPNFFERFTVRDQLRFIYTLPIGRMLSGVNARIHFLPTKALKNEGARYSFDTLNGEGEIINAPMDEMARERHQNALTSKPTEDILKGFHQRENLERIASFVEYSRRNGIDILAAHPPYRKFSDYSLESLKIISQIEQFYLKENVALITSAEEEFWSDEFIFDDVYHLTEAGAELRSRNLVKLLLPHLETPRMAKKKGIKIRSVGP